jgi:hypothetical protein
MHPREKRRIPENSHNGMSQTYLTTNIFSKVTKIICVPFFFAFLDYYFLLIVHMLFVDNTCYLSIFSTMHGLGSPPLAMCALLCLKFHYCEDLPNTPIFVQIVSQITCQDS